MQSQFLYIMENSDGFVKIGVAKDPHDRLYSIQTGSSEDVWLVGTFGVKNPKRIEKELHNRFYKYNESGEWFDISEETTELLISELRDRVSGESPETVAAENGVQTTFETI